MTVEESAEDLVRLLRMLKNGEISELAFIKESIDIALTPITRELRRKEEKGIAQHIDFDELFGLYKDCGFIDKEEGYCEKRTIGSHNDKSIADLTYDIVMVPLLNEIDKKIKTEYDNLELGALVAGLIFYGSNRHQAELAITDWLGFSTTKVKNGYVEHKKRHKEHNLDYCLACYSGINIPIGSFPQSYPAAYQAFQEIQKELKEYLRA